MAGLPINKYISQHQKGKKQKFHLPLSAWLSYLVIATLLLGSVSLAKYTTSTTDSDGARVAKFEVAATPDGESSQTNKITLNLVEREETESYSFLVSNNSEVVVRYKIIVSNVPEHIYVSLNDGEFQGSTTGTVTFDSNNVLDINGEAPCTLTFKAGNELTGPKLYEEKMKIEVRFVQVD